MAAIATGLFERVARSPHAVLFPALATEPGRALQVVQRLHGPLLATAQRFAAAVNAMAIPVDEVCARLLTFAEAFLAPRSPEEVQSGLPQLLAPLRQLLEALDAERPSGRSSHELLALMGCRPSLASVYARRFLTTFVPPLRRRQRDPLWPGGQDGLWPQGLQGQRGGASEEHRGPSPHAATQLRALHPQLRAPGGLGAGALGHAARQVPPWIQLKVNNTIIYHLSLLLAASKSINQNVINQVHE